MSAVATLPFTDLIGMFVWFLGFLAVNLLPGYWLVGRHLRHQDHLTRAYCSIAAGICAVTIAGLLLTVLRIPATWPSVLLVLVGTGVASHLSPAWRDGLEQMSERIPPVTALQNALVLVAVASLALVMQMAFRDFAASPHLHDASNHSFLVKRILESRSMAMGRIFADPYALPRFDYLPGWHMSAALISSITGIKPFISAWYFAVACAAMLPVALMLAWRILGVAPAVAAIACLIAASNYYTPINIFSWGGYGQIIGLFLTPWIVYLAHETIRSARLTIAAICGMHLVALLHIHGSEIYLTMVLTALTVSIGWRPQSWGSLFKVLGLSFGLLLLLGILPLVVGSFEFAVSGSRAPSASSRSFEDTLNLLRTFAAGNTHKMARLVIPGLVFGLLAPRFRKLALATLVIALVYLSLETFADPVSRALTKPMYHHSARLAHWFVFFVPVLYAGALFFLIRSCRWIFARGHPAIVKTVGILVWIIVPMFAWMYLWPNLYWSYRVLAGQQIVVAFDEDDARLAARMAAELPATTVIANQDNDGSYWFMHASGLRFLDPTSWELGAGDGITWRGRIDMLAQSPWPPQVTPIREAGAEFYLVSDALIRGLPPQVTRDQLRDDPRFEAVFEGTNTTLFRILWDSASASP